MSARQKFYTQYRLARYQWHRTGKILRTDAGALALTWRVWMEGSRPTRLNAADTLPF